MRSSGTWPSPSAATTMTSSRLAASVWNSPRLPPRQRAKALRRGSTSSMTPMSWSGGTATATQSPTVGMMPASAAAPFAKSTECSARSVRSSHATSGNPRSSRTTQPRSSVRAYSSPRRSATRPRASANAASCASSALRSPKAGTFSSSSVAGSVRRTLAAASPLARPRYPRPPDARETPPLSGRRLALPEPFAKRLPTHTPHDLPAQGLAPSTGTA